MRCLGETRATPRAVLARSAAASTNRMKKRVIVLGSTGSIGRSSLDVLSRLEEEWQVVGLAAGSRWSDLGEQANRLRPEAVALTRECEELRRDVPRGVHVLTGPDAMVRLVESVPCDCVISAVVGASGLPATLRAVELGLRVGLANKEPLVMAGSVIMPLAARTGSTIIPIDSEHSAVFQALHAGRREDVRAVYLTASGGPFRTWDAARIAEATWDDAMRHPTWRMGPKVTVDSATMMNKALEIVEARWLFDLEPDQIHVVIHPESIIHSLVEFRDGSMIAQLGTPDMRTPIQYALTYPARRDCPSAALNLAEVGRLNLHAPDEQKFPALRLGKEVARRGGTAGAAMNGANEAAVDLFRRSAIPFGEITRSVDRAVRTHRFHGEPALAELMAADTWAREEVAKCLVS